MPVYLPIMPSLLLVVFFLQLAIHIINSVGATAINELIWTLYNKTPVSSTAPAVAKSTTLRKESMRLQRELNATSAQDDFAKWAKLRRQLDKTNADHEKIASSLQSTKSTFDSRIGTLRFLLTTALRMFLQFYHTKTPMFYIPQGWVPYYVEWILSFPKAPLGAVSIQMWFIACGSVIALVGEAVVAIWALVVGGLQSRKLEKAKERVKEEKSREKVAMKQ